MKTINEFKEKVQNSFAISSPLLLESALKQVTEAKELIQSQLNEDSTVKVPIVGDFSAGKSSLINSFLGKNELLPVDITPETAVAYELYYSNEEHVDLYRDDKKIQTESLSDIKSLNTAPGDIAKVYINSEKIKVLQDKGLTLVDMPGIDSGIKEHNDAIVNYITKGASFILLVDIGQGTLRQSTLAFMSELSKYNLIPAVLISKIDKKPESEIVKIKDLVEFQSQKSIGEKTFVGCVSAHNNQISDFQTYLDSINGDKIIKEKYGTMISHFIDAQIISLKTQADLLKVDITNVKEKIQKLEEQKKNLTAEFELGVKKADTPEKSTEDILGKVKEELFLHKREFAEMMVNGNSNEEIQARILNYIRPVIIKSRESENEQYIKNFDSALTSFISHIINVLQLKDNNIIGNVLKENKTNIINGLAYAGMIIARIPNPITKVLGLILTVIGKYIPDWIRELFGESKEKRIQKKENQIVRDLIPDILNQLRPTILQNISSTQKELRDIMKESMTKTIEKIQDALNNSAEQSKLANNESRLSLLEKAIVKLESIKSIG